MENIKTWAFLFTGLLPEGSVARVGDVRLRTGGDLLTVEIPFPGQSTPVTLHGILHGETTARLTFLGHRIALMVGEHLADEDWPLGQAQIAAPRYARACAFEETDDLSIIEETSAPRWIDGGFLPAGHNVSAGDCMPFAHENAYHLFYLFDRRGHKSKWGLGAHQWAHISTEDFKTWKTHPMAIAIDHQWEGSICTGSTIYHEGKFYCFYAVRMSDHSPAKLTMSISDDGEHYEKTGHTFTLTEPYEPTSARDPKVFRDENGLFHMLVTTSVENRGALAHLTSENLLDWAQHEPLMVMADGEQPECPDYFYFGGKYCLIYSIRAQAICHTADQPLGPWSVPVPIDLPGYCVPKAAIWHDRLIFSGFLSRAPGGYAGEVRLAEGFIGEDGLLHVPAFIDEI